MTDLETAKNLPSKKFSSCDSGNWIPPDFVTSYGKALTGLAMHDTTSFFMCSCNHAVWLGGKEVLWALASKPSVG
ncbi:hypothetical protein D3C85_1559050 [compost metagenome]